MCSFLFLFCLGLCLLFCWLRHPPTVLSPSFSSWPSASTSPTLLLHLMCLPHHLVRVHKPKRRQYLEEEDEEPQLVEDTGLTELTKEEKIELLDFEERCGYFGHVKL